jgi:flagellar protein FlaG
MAMRIESTIPDMPREMQIGVESGSAGGRQVKNTSKPEGGNPTPTRPDTVSMSTGSLQATVQKPIDVKDAVEKLNKYVQSQQKYINFSIDESTQSTVIKIYKTETGELIKQFPPEEILAMAAHISQSIGWLVDSKA